MKIGLDFDGVTGYTTKLWVEKFNEKYQTSITTRNIDRWGFYEPLGITLNECMEIFGETWKDWKKLEPMEQDMWQKTRMLCNLGTVDIVTNASPDVRLQLEKWLGVHKISYNELIFSSSKWDLDYDVFIDDSPSNIEKIYKAGKIALVYNHAWNRDIKEKSNVFEHGACTYVDHDKGQIRRIYNLYHAIDFIKGIRFE